MGWWGQANYTGLLCPLPRGYLTEFMEIFTWYALKYYIKNLLFLWEYWMKFNIALTTCLPIYIQIIFCNFSHMKWNRNVSKFRFTWSWNTKVCRVICWNELNYIKSIFQLLSKDGHNNSLRRNWMQTWFTPWGQQKPASNLATSTQHTPANYSEMLSSNWVWQFHQFRSLHFMPFLMTTQARKNCQNLNIIKYFRKYSRI